MRDIAILPDHIINQIAAGEVVERPASVIKELIENSLDAGAKFVTITVENSGKNLISVIDDGHGMTPVNLRRCLERHATSKLWDNDLHNLHFFGFRGEALPSIAAVAEVIIISKTEHDEHGYQIISKNGELSAVIPAASNNGTTIEVRNLFSYTPARLKFMRSEASEKACIVDLLLRFSLMHPHVHFRLLFNTKKILDLPATTNLKERLASAISKEFIDQAHEINYINNGIKINGYLARPTYHHSSTEEQYLFVNQRIVKDKLIQQAIKIAYHGLLPHGRHARLVLFITVDMYQVDVNAHPHKTEVRFQEPQKIREAITHAIRQTLAHDKQDNHASITSQVIEANEPRFHIPYTTSAKPNKQFHMQEHKTANTTTTSFYNAPTVNSTKHDNILPEIVAANKFGYAQFQIANRFIIAKNAEGLLLVDQHAAHERIVLEQLKIEWSKKSISVQTFLIPLVMHLPPTAMSYVESNPTCLDAWGFAMHIQADHSIAIAKAPAIIAEEDLEEVILSVIYNLMEYENSQDVENYHLNILNSIACHGSIRSGRVMSIVEMNNLLRDMERYPFSEQCNHGRPTWKQLTIAELNKMFER